MANWINGAINSGYTVVSGSLTGTANAKVACWLEYRLISQSIVNNTSTIRVYGYLATAQNTSKYWTYWNNHTGDNRGMFKIFAAGTLVYERQKRGFATSNIPTPSDYTIYVWGAQGQQGEAITEAWIRRRETSTTNANRAIKFWKRQCAAGYAGVLRAFDCSGLGVYFLLENGLIKYPNYYGSTRALVKKYQKDKNLKVDGIAGKQTITSLNGIWGG